MDLRNPNRVNSGPDGTFVDRNTTPGAERPGTVIDALTFNQMLAEFENFIKGAGLTPSSTDLSQLAKINGDMLTERIINLVYPIGYDYIQIADDDGTFDIEKSPAVLFGGSWSIRYNFDSVFLRTEGGLADEDGRDARGIQQWAIENIIGEYKVGDSISSFYRNSSGVWQINTNGAFSYKNYNKNCYGVAYEGSGQSGNAPSLLFDASRVAKTGKETRGINIKMRLYRKVGNAIKQGDTK